VKACQRIDFMFDEKICADGEVIDIKVHHDYNTGIMGTPVQMEEQPLRYDVGRREFLKGIYDWYQKLCYDLRPRQPILQPKLHNLIIEAISVLAPNQDNNTVVKVHKKTRIDDYRMDYTIKNKIIPNMGNKFTDLFGGKGVVVSIWEDEDMPVDADGNRAEMIFDQAAVNNRMIPGRLYEHIINGAARDVYKQVVRILGVQDRQRRSRMMQELMQVQRERPQDLSHAWEYLLGFYDITVPRQAAVFREGRYDSTPISHLSYILSKGHAVLYMRSDHELELKNMVADIQRLYPPTFTPVTYRTGAGILETTVEPIRIAPLSIIMLEKIADSWSAVASARRQHAGVVATLSNADKYSERIRMQPTKAYGESEIRIVISYSGTLTAAEILDRNNSVEAHKAMCWSIFEAESPTRIVQAVDRQAIPLDGSRSLQTVNHVWACGGYEMAWEPYRPTHPANLNYYIDNQPAAA
jgi:DNA-directed RNA polymerase beta subunit